MKQYQITEWCANFIRAKVRPGDLCIDATMGNGNDTLLLCRLCGEKGRVLAFDIQEAALAHTRERLLQEGAPSVRCFLPFKRPGKTPGLSSTTIYLWLISLTASKELSILLLKLYNDGAIGMSTFFLGPRVRMTD